MSGCTSKDHNTLGELQYLGLWHMGSGCSTEDGREFETAIRDVGNEGFTEFLELTRFILLHPVAANLAVLIVLEALVDTKANGQAEPCLQVLNYLICKGLGLKMVLNMDSGDDDMLQEFGLIRGVKDKKVVNHIIEIKQRRNLTTVHLIKGAPDSPLKVLHQPPALLFCPCRSLMEQPWPSFPTSCGQGEHSDNNL